MTAPVGIDSVYLNAAGLCTSLGPDLATTAARYAARKKAFFKDPNAIGADGLPITYAPVFRLHDIHNHELRLARMMERAVQDIGAQISLTAYPVRVIMFLPAWLRHSGFGTRPADWPAAFEGLAEAAFTPVWSDQATVAATMVQAMQTVARDPAHDVILAVADTCLVAELLDGLVASDRILARHQPHGLIPAEAAAVLRFTTADRVTFDAPLGRIDGHWAGHETQNPQAPDDMLGDAMAPAFCAGAAHAPADRMLVDLNGERWRSEEIAMCLARSEDIDPALTADFETPPLHLGHCGHATMAVMAALALMPAPKPTQNATYERSLIAQATFSGPRDVLGLVRDTRAGIALKQQAS